MNEYLRDNLWTYDNLSNFVKIIKFLKTKNTNTNFNFKIYENYLNIISLNNTDLNTYSLLTKSIIQYLEEENKKIEDENREQIISTSKNKRKIKTLIFNNNLINRIKFNNKDSKIKKINKTQIIKTYNKLIDKNYIIYTEIWNTLINDNTLLKNSPDLILLHIIKDIKDIFNSTNTQHNIDESINSYFNHTATLAHLYFDSNKYLDENKTLQFIYDLLIHLTKTHICFGIEILVRKIIFNSYLMNNLESDVLLIQTKIDNILNKYFLKINDNSFIEKLYGDIPEKFVKNSLLIFKNIKDKVNFIPESINEILEDLFNLLKSPLDTSNIITDTVMNILNINVKNYFNLFIEKIIKNWYVVCENILKFIINQDRIIQLLILSDDKLLNKLPNINDAEANKYIIDEQLKEQVKKNKKELNKQTRNRKGSIFSN